MKSIGCIIQYPIWDFTSIGFIGLSNCFSKIKIFVDVLKTLIYPVLLQVSLNKVFSM